MKNIMAGLQQTNSEMILLSWVRQSTRSYPQVNVTNFTTSWSDGLAFNALLHSHRWEKQLFPLSVSSYRAWGWSVCCVEGFSCFLCWWFSILLNDWLFALTWVLRFVSHKTLSWRESFSQHNQICTAQLLFLESQFVYQEDSLKEYRLGNFWEEKGVSKSKPLRLFQWRNEIFLWVLRGGKFGVCWQPLIAVELKIWICLTRTQRRWPLFSKHFMLFHQLIWVFSLSQKLPSSSLCCIKLYL